MNHCHDCNSDYATPGSCNCFAVGGKRYAAPVLSPTVPYWPYPNTWIPWSPPYWTGGYTLTTTASDDLRIYNTAGGQCATIANTALPCS